MLRTCSRFKSTRTEHFYKMANHQKNREDIGLQAAFRSVFPIESYSGNAALEFVEYSLGKPEFDVRECILRGSTYAAPMRVKIRLILKDRETKSIKDVQNKLESKPQFVILFYNYAVTLATTPAPTVRPPSRIAKRRPGSIAIGWINSTDISTLSPGITISTPSCNLIAPVTSVVRK